MTKFLDDTTESIAEIPVRQEDPIQSEDQFQEALTSKETLINPKAWEVFKDAASSKLKWPMYLMDSDSPLSQREILVAWIMDVESIGGSAHDLNPNILEANKHLGGERRKTAEAIIDDLKSLQGDANMLKNAWDAHVDPIIYEASHFLYQTYSLDDTSEEMTQLKSLNAAKTLFKSVYAD